MLAKREVVYSLYGADMIEKNGAAEWHYVGPYGQLGPWTTSQIAELVDQGVIAQDTLVWKRGWTGWRKAASVPELGVRMGPPPVPKLTHDRLEDLLPPQQTVSYPDPFTELQTPRTHSPVLPTVWEPIRSARNRYLAGVLNLLLPGVGRVYLGYVDIGVFQLLVTLFTCGLGVVWPWIDGLLMLLGGVPYDADGKRL